MTSDFSSKRVLIDTEGRTWLMERQGQEIHAQIGEGSGKPFQNRMLQASLPGDETMILISAFQRG